MNFITIHTEENCFDVTAKQDSGDMHCWEFKTLEDAQSWCDKYIALMEEAGEQWWMRRSHQTRDTLNIVSDVHDNSAKAH